MKVNEDAEATVLELRAAVAFYTKRCAMLRGGLSMAIEGLESSGSLTMTQKSELIEQLKQVREESRRARSR